ncbi:MAG: Rrf2 family transcriptional regulator [Acidaminococcus sp.]|uniref:Rrf2 family transcriptional regulator n=1 Tax=Acidaminococcus intestini TaxID=187327 RepID=A0A943I202_9FIRM|nr:Rrf2 family transcriptional regulator [Acidaminococcus sp.]MBS5520445.1 Rrf2 family transcriptional regulator [Acidaminococcus intestini]MDY2738647.1 Rrf2 family transcriptional regulator [Acidaminococcus sp.]
MSISVGVEYALHCLIYLAIPTASRSIGIKEMAAFQGISETYLSKIFMKLRKKGLVSAVPGVKGGYRLSREADEITFWDVVEAIEGPQYQFQCAEIRQHMAIVEPHQMPPAFSGCPCLISEVMKGAEDQYRTYLKGRTIGWLYRMVKDKLEGPYWKAIESWAAR